MLELIDKILRMPPHAQPVALVRPSATFSREEWDALLLAVAVRAPAWEATQRISPSR